ncbi:hypothetical protein N7492_000916 [Penicillium capsulatum]|uniref:Aminoglycoside phosphotransferase domain-containing protein n=1 Tax=Penicillium capsulatum TaxID=69766 RepID=A0A9W9IUJ7_9EURO|nr:hypothetical protein N7492_000916 [Penicillium capsulatum]
MMIRGFANYFGRVYKTAKRRSPTSLYPQLVFTRQRLLEFREKGILPVETIDQLIDAVPTLFGDQYRQGITNGNLSQTNIRIDSKTYEICGIVDWSCARIFLFGTEMDILIEFTGFKDFGTWCDYECKSKCISAFWDRFWISSGIGAGLTGISQQNQIRELAMTTAKINAILRLGFQRNQQGWSVGEFLCTIADRQQLQAWFGVL